MGVHRKKIIKRNYIKKYVFLKKRETVHNKKTHPYKKPSQLNDTHSRWLSKWFFYNFQPYEKKHIAGG